MADADERGFCVRAILPLRHDEMVGKHALLRKVALALFEIFMEGFNVCLNDGR